MPQKAANDVAGIWTRIIDNLPHWDEVSSGARKPNAVREEFVFAHGIGWQAIAQAASVMARECGAGWLGGLETVLKSIDWSKTNPQWQNVCMIGDRMNNTGPGVRATAGFILLTAEVQTGAAASLIDQYNRSLAEVPAEAVSKVA